jgi:hypothetical protein
MPLANPAATVDEQAFNRLAELEAEQAREASAMPNAPSKDTPNADDRASAEPETKTGTPDSKDKSGIPSDADKQEIENAKVQAEKEGKELEVDDKGLPKRDAQGKFLKRDKVAPEKPIELTAEEKVRFDKYAEQRARGKYAKDAVRNDRSWRVLDETKEKFKVEMEQRQKSLQGAIAKFNADVKQFQTERDANRQTPERFDVYANTLETDAKLKEAQRLTAQANGDLESERKLDNEVAIIRNEVDKARKMAQHLRQNPPPNAKQIQEKFKADQNTWIEKANVDFPEFAKKDTPVRNAAVETYKEITAADPQLAQLPGLIYHCVRYAAAKTAADRVPSLDKELGELRTKVKELELLTNPTPQGGIARSQGAKSFDDMTLDEQYEQLRRESIGMKR